GNQCCWTWEPMLLDLGTNAAGLGNQCWTWEPMLDLGTNSADLGTNAAGLGNQCCWT
ncbi:unnamed protein product, partial [Allacma fusca]